MLKQVPLIVAGVYILFPPNYGMVFYVYLMPFYTPISI